MEIHTKNAVRHQEDVPRSNVAVMRTVFRVTIEWTACARQVSSEVHTLDAMIMTNALEGTFVASMPIAAIPLVATHASVTENTMEIPTSDARKFHQDHKSPNVPVKIVAAIMTENVAPQTSSVTSIFANLTPVVSTHVVQMHFVQWRKGNPPANVCQRSLWAIPMTSCMAVKVTSVSTICLSARRMKSASWDHKDSACALMSVRSLSVDQMLTAKGAITDLSVCARPSTLMAIHMI